MGATYTIYSNFQGTFVRQINHNNMKQEARFALHVLQHDSKMAGYKHPDSTDGEVQEPVKVLNMMAQKFQMILNMVKLFLFVLIQRIIMMVNIQRKFIKYELQKSSILTT